MKKVTPLLAVAAAFMFGGCSMSAYEAVYYTDYTRYMKQSFFVSALSDFNGYPYVSMGHIAIEYGEPGFLTPSVDETSQSILTRLVNAAKAVGANGVINVNISHNMNPKSGQFYWFASGIAVRFETLPMMPHSADITLDASAQQVLEESVFDVQKWIDETISYLLENKMPFYKVLDTGQVGYFDIETQQYITTYAFVKKYGKEPKDALLAQYETAYKAKKKSEKEEKLRLKEEKKKGERN